MAHNIKLYNEIVEWCRSERINWRWITEYPEELFNDMMLLRKIRTNFWYLFTPRQRALWCAVWGWTTKKQQAISQENLNKLEQAVESAEAVKQLIKARRHQVTNRNMI